MPVVMHFATFLKLLTLNMGDKIRDLERYAKPGGFDFYRPSRDGIVKHCSAGRTRENVLRDIENSATTKSVDRNKEVFERVAVWVAGHPGQASIPKRAVWRSPHKTFSVHIEPELSYQAKNAQHVVAIYPSKDVRINRDQAGAGLILLSRGYRGSGNEKFGILDAFAGKVHRTPTNISERLLENEIATIETELSRIL
ncbi:hypothetical protein [Martelella sp. FOR1707]